MPVLQAAAVLIGGWSLGKALVNFLISAGLMTGAYFLSKFVFSSVLESWVFPVVPSWIMCAMFTLEFDKAVGVIFAALQGRLFLNILLSRAGIKI